MISGCYNYQEVSWDEKRGGPDGEDFSHTSLTSLGDEYSTLILGKVIWELTEALMGNGVGLVVC